MNSIGDPRSEWTSAEASWKRSRAVIDGPGAARAHDAIINYNNLLIPFSVKMTQEQYEILKAEAELPCITAQFLKILVESLLRKRPTIEVGDDDLKSWLLDEFGQDGSPIESLLSEAAQEELSTGNAWVFVDHPTMDERMLEQLTPEERDSIRPYAVVRKAEEVINWQYGVDALGKRQLLLVIVRTYRSKLNQGQVHPVVHEVLYLHFLNEKGEYCVQEYVGKEVSNPESKAGKRTPNKTAGEAYTPGAIIRVLSKGAPLYYVPAWPISSNLEDITSPLMPIVEREIALYNKMTRRNHLLYNASTFTPVVIGDMADEVFKDAVSGGLGTWMKFPSETSIDTIKTPTEALADYDRAISDGIKEIAALGVRMLTPETTQSGIALRIRNAAQTAQLGSLSNDLSNAWRQVIRCMIHWRTGKEPDLDTITFSLSNDFLSGAVGEEMLRLLGDWYERGLIDRGLFIHSINQNGLLPDGYDDAEALTNLRNGSNLPPLEP